jgi:hypothetical protein
VRENLAARTTSNTSGRVYIERACFLGESATLPSVGRWATGAGLPLW